MLTRMSYFHAARLARTLRAVAPALIGRLKVDAAEVEFRQGRVEYLLHILPSFWLTAAHHVLEGFPFLVLALNRWIGLDDRVVTPAEQTQRENDFDIPVVCGSEQAIDLRTAKLCPRMALVISGGYPYVAKSPQASSRLKPALLCTSIAAIVLATFLCRDAAPATPAAAAANSACH